LIEVFGDNAKIGLCFYFASLFRDHIAEVHGFFPILNLFGPKGSGKTEMAVSLLQFFGAHVKGPNLTNTSKAALADHVALLVNGFCHIDEYTNDLEIEKVEFLKGLWDGTGRTRMNMDKDKKKETTPVDCGIILTGQQMPTIDNALFSRLIFLSFSKVEFSENEKDAFLKLKKIEKMGLCHITNELLNQREHFISNYHNAYDQTAQDLNSAMEYKVIEDRTFKNWQVIIASYSAMKDMIKVPWTYTELITLAASMITQQDQCTKNANELSSFWETVEFLTSENKIMDKVDFKIELTSNLHTEKIKYKWPSAKRILMINQTRIIPLYQEHGYRTKVKTLPSKSLIHYLKASKTYLGSKSSVSFKVLDNGRVMEDREALPISSEGNCRKVQRRITSAMCFDYEELGISLVTEKINLEQEDESSDELPF